MFFVFWKNKHDDVFGPTMSLGYKPCQDDKLREPNNI